MFSFPLLIILLAILFLSSRRESNSTQKSFTSSRRSSMVFMSWSSRKSSSPWLLPSAKVSSSANLLPQICWRRTSGWFGLGRDKVSSSPYVRDCAEFDIEYFLEFVYTHSSCRSMVTTNVAVSKLENKRFSVRKSSIELASVAAFIPSKCKLRTRGE
jgi:hypothetical protein